MTAQTILPANSVVDTGLATNSVRLDGVNAYLHFTNSSGNRRTWTYSTWVKRSKLINDKHVFFENNTGNNDAGYMQFRFQEGEVINLTGYNTDWLTTNRVFRDCSAWYHIVLAVDTTNSTAGNRLRLYVNGVEETSFSVDNNPDEDEDLPLNLNNSVTYIGAGGGGSNRFFDGYMAETVLIDGLQLTPTSFGEFDEDSGIWIPISVSGLTRGTNGFYLNFKDGSNLGNDAFGDTDLTEVNLAATDQTTDTCTNNYCTINPQFADDGNNLLQANFTEGNVKMLSTVDGWKFGRGTFLLDAGKWYVEAKVTENSAGQSGRFGIVPSEGGITLGNSDDNDVFEGLAANLGGDDTNLDKLDTGTGSTLFSDLASGDITMLAIDLDNNKIWVGNEGVWYNNNNASTTLSSSNHDIALPTVNNGWVFGLGQYRDGNNNITWEYNWGNPSFAVSSSNADADGHGNFEFAVPSGFFAVNSKNLAEYG